MLRDVVHEVTPSALTELEQLADEPHRWWSPAEITGSTERFEPPALAALLAELAAGPWTGPPRVLDDGG